MTLAHLRSRLDSRMRSPLLTRTAVLSVAAFVVMAAPSRAQTPATPPAGAAAVPGTAATNAAAAPQTTPALAAPRQSWYADRRTFAVGDIVTVLIDDYTITTAVKEDIASDTRSRNLGLTARLPTASKSVGLQTSNDASQNARGSAKRENRFQNEMSVRVVAIGANGLLQLKGTKNIDVDKSKQDIVLTGWVRAQDISSQNMVESARLADASIGYTSPGTLNKPKQGMISKILGAFWP